jgi:hypothetical protein
LTQLFRIFLASPGDVAIERDAFTRAVEEVNETTCPILDCRLEAVKWETHACPDAGRPQQVINEQLGDYDIFLGVMWRRFGTPSGAAGSGTEEEYRIAYERWRQDSTMPLMFYFCQTPFYPASLEELDQMRQVLLFRKELEGRALAWTYDNHQSFESLIRKHLAQRLPRLVEARQGMERSRAIPNDRAIDSLRELWSRLDHSTQRAINIAYNENRLAGDPGIQSRDLFSALLRIEDQPLSEITREIPRAALPEPTPGPVAEDTYILGERPWLSGCVAASIDRLVKSAPDGYKITPTDIFTDIARNGTGASVALLRQYDIGPADIDAILDKKQISSLRTI